MATTPVAPPAAAEENPWQGLTPKDILTDPGFHKLSKEARRIIASKVWEDFGKADQLDQDATLNAPLSHWTDYFAPPPPPPEPGIMERTGKWIGETAKGLGTAIIAGQGQAAKQRAESALPDVRRKPSDLPKELPVPPEIDELIMQRQQEMRNRRPTPKPKGKDFSTIVEEHAEQSAELAFRADDADKKQEKLKADAAKLAKMQAEMESLKSAAEAGDDGAAEKFNNRVDGYNKAVESILKKQDEFKGEIDQLNKDIEYAKKARGHIEGIADTGLTPTTGPQPGVKVAAETDPIKLLETVSPELKSTASLQPSVSYKSATSLWDYIHEPVSDDVFEKTGLPRRPADGKLDPARVVVAKEALNEFYRDGSIGQYDLNEALAYVDAMATGVLPPVDTPVALLKIMNRQAIQEQVPRVVMVDGEPVTFSPVKTTAQAKELTEEDIRRINYDRIMGGLQVIPSRRIDNAITSGIKAMVQAVPGTIKSLAAISHQAGMHASPKYLQYREGLLEPPKLEDTVLWRAAKRIEDKIDAGLPVNPLFQEEMWANIIPQGVGSSLYFLAMAGAAGATGGAAAILPTVASAGIGFEMGGLYEEAYRAGGNQQQLLGALLTSIPLGAAEALPLERAIMRLDKVTGGYFSRWLKNRMARGIIAGGLAGGAEEAIQEFGQEIGGSWYMSHMFGEDIDWGMAAKQGAAGGVTGAALSAVMSAIGVGRTRSLLRNTYRQRVETMSDRMRIDGASQKEIDKYREEMKSEEKEFIKTIEEERDAAERKADKAQRKWEEIAPGAPAVMIGRFNDNKEPFVAAILSKKDANTIRGISEATDIPAAEFEDLLKQLSTSSQTAQQADVTDVPTVGMEAQMASEEVMQAVAGLSAQMRDGSRRAMIIPSGLDQGQRKTVIAETPASSRVAHTEIGDVIYDPTKITLDELVGMISGGNIVGALGPGALSVLPGSAFSTMLSNVIDTSKNDIVNEKETIDAAFGEGATESILNAHDLFVGNFLIVLPTFQGKTLRDVRQWLLEAQESILAMAGNVTDAEGDSAARESATSIVDAVLMDATNKIIGILHGFQPAPASQQATPSTTEASEPTEEGQLDTLPIGRTVTDRREQQSAPAETSQERRKADRRQDYTRRKQIADMTREEIITELLTDPLTGLLNRSAWDRAPFTKFVAAIDLDKMKRMNDTYGQEAGDAYLRHAAEGFRQSGIDVYRLGGDDFNAKSNSREDIDSAMGRAKQWFMDNSLTIQAPAGPTQVNVAFSYGIGEGMSDAFSEMKKAKQAGIESGEIERRYEGKDGSSSHGDERAFNPDGIREKLRDIVAEATSLREQEDAAGPILAALTNEELLKVMDPENSAKIEVNRRPKMRRPDGTVDWAASEWLLRNIDNIDSAPEDVEPTPAPEPVPTPAQKSFMFEIKAAGDKSWGTNNMRYATREEAEAAGRDLFNRWFAADEYRVTESDDPISARWNAETNQSEIITEQETAPAAEPAPQEPTTGPLSALFTQDPALAPTSIIPLQSALSTAEEVGIADDILSWFIAGDKVADIAKKVIESGSAPGMSVIKIKTIVSSIRKYFGIPLPEQAEFASWQAVMQGKLANWTPAQTERRQPVIPKELAPEPAPLTKPTPQGPNPFAWSERGEVDVDDTVLTPRGAGVVEEVLDDDIEVGLGRRGTDRFHKSDVVLLDMDKLDLYMPDIEFSPAPDNLAINPASRFARLIPSEVYWQLAEDLLGTMLAYKRAEYEHEYGMPGSRAIKLQGIMARYEEILSDISSAFGSNVSAIVRKDVESIISKSFGEKDAGQESVEPEPVDERPHTNGVPSPGSPLFAATSEWWGRQSEEDRLKMANDVGVIVGRDGKPIQPDKLAAMPVVSMPDYAVTKLSDMYLNSTADNKPVIVIVRGLNGWEADFSGTPEGPAMKSSAGSAILPTPYTLDMPINKVVSEVQSRNPEYHVVTAEQLAAKKAKTGGKKTPVDVAFRRRLFEKGNVVRNQADNTSYIVLEYNEKPSGTWTVRTQDATAAGVPVPGTERTHSVEPTADHVIARKTEGITPVTSEIVEAPGLTETENPAVVILDAADDDARLLAELGLGEDVEGYSAFAAPGSTPPRAKPTREEMLANPKILDILGELGSKYLTATSADRTKWHASMHAHLNRLVDGLGDDLESLFSVIWEATTDEGDYAGGIGGVYGAKEGLPESEAGGVRPDAIETGGAHGGMQPGGTGETGAGGETAGVLGGEVGTGEAGIPSGEGVGAEPGPGGGIGGPRTVPGAGAGLGTGDAVGNTWFTYTPDVGMGAAGWGLKRMEENLAAIRKVVQLRRENRMPTYYEQVVLARFVGWGALWRIFDPGQYKYEEQHRELRTLLDPVEFSTAVESTQNAHYTAEPLARALWAVAQRLGYYGGGLVMEGAAGSGIFLGTAPSNIVESSEFIGTEMDSMSASIVKFLYPKAKVLADRFENLEFPDNSVDLAISNVPFGRIKAYDPRYRAIAPSIHDYYFLKTADKLRPGGLMIYITSTYTMDKNSTSVRRLLANKMDLVTMYRLPNRTFETNAGTSVATDVIIMKKRAPGQEAGDTSWIESSRVDVPNITDGGTGSLSINKWYQNNPSNILGTMGQGQGMYSGMDPVVVPFTNVLDEHASLVEWVSNKIADLAEQLKPVYEPSFDSNPAEVVRMVDRFSPGSVWDGQIILDDDGDLARMRDGYLQKIDDPKYSAPGAKEKVVELIAIRESLWDLFRIQLEDASDESVRAAQKRLGALYDDFIMKWGTKTKGKISPRYINSRMIETLMAGDPTLYYLMSLEVVNKDDGSNVKSAIFTERSMWPEAKLTSLPEDVNLASRVVLAYKGSIDLEFMASISDKTAEQWKQELIEKSIAFMDPVTGNMTLAEEYLSGDMYDKLLAAENAAKLDPEYQRNVAALKDSFPPPLLVNHPEGPKKSFHARLGMRLIPEDIYRKFIIHIFESDEMHAEIALDADGIYRIRLDGYVSPHINRKWGTDRIRAIDLFVAAINQSTVIVYDPVTDENGRERLVKNKDETKKGKLVQAKIRDEFTNWARDNADIAIVIEKVANEALNRFKEREYDGSFLEFPGMNTSILRDGKLSPHQYNAVWRIIREGRALLAHCVGSGKTFVMAAAAMEMKRLGLVKKPMIAIPKKIYRQFGQEFASLYPGAKLLIVTSKDFQPKNRKKLLAKIAMNDWDAVVISQSMIKMIPVSPALADESIRKLIDELEQQLGQLGKPKNKKQAQTVKRIQQQLANYRTQLKELADISQDDTVYFDKMGVDFLLVDEAHAYKNLSYPTRHSQVSGVGGTESKGALMMKIKTDYLLSKSNGRGVVFATGTPVTRSMAELYTLSRFLDPGGLEASGIAHFDSWAANFGEIKLDLTPTIDGKGFKTQIALAKFANLKQLRSTFARYADVVTSDMIFLPIPKQIDENGNEDKPTVVKLQMGFDQSRYFDAIRKRLEYVDGPHDPSIDNHLNIMTDARKASLDMRLVGPQYADNPDSKANAAVSRMAEYYHAHSEDRRTQVAFTGVFQNKISGFNLYEDMKKKLIAAGVPENEIAIIHDYKTDDRIKSLYKAVRDGRVRILLTTSMTAEGANIQDRLGILHHLDAPYNPSEIEQREGRILRQGNLHHKWNEPVQIIQYITEESLDGRLFNLLRRKATFIRQYLKGEIDDQTAEDPTANVVITFAMLAAEASGNPDMVLRIELLNKLDDLIMLRERHLHAQWQIKQALASIGNEIAKAQTRAAAFSAAIAKYESHREPFKFKLDGKEFTDPDGAIEYLRDMKQKGMPNPKIAEGKELDEGEPAIVPYVPVYSGRKGAVGTVEEAIEKINWASVAENREFKFNAVINGTKYDKMADADAIIKAHTEAGKAGGAREKLEIEVYGFPFTVQNQHNGFIDNNPLFGQRLHDYSMESLTASIVFRLRDLPHMLASAEKDIERGIAERGRLEADYGKPFAEQAEYVETVTELIEVNRRLGIDDSITDLGIDPDDAELEGINIIEEAEETDTDDDDGDDSGYSGYDMMEAYRQIGVVGTRQKAVSDPNVLPGVPEEVSAAESGPEGGIVLPADFTAEPSQAAVGGPKVPSKVVLELEELPRVIEMGSMFLFSMEESSEVMDQLDAGTVPQTLIDDILLKGGRGLGEIVRVSKLPNEAGWEISDGLSLIQFRRDLGGDDEIQVWDHFAVGRAEIPELMEMIELIIKKPLLLRKLKTNLGYFKHTRPHGTVAVRPDLAYMLKDREMLARVIAHELGHAIDFAPDDVMGRGKLIGRLRSLVNYRKSKHEDFPNIDDATLRKELIKLSEFWRPYDPQEADAAYIEYRETPQELYADFVSAMLLSPGTAERIAPTMYHGWLRGLDFKPDVKKAFYQVRMQLIGTREELLDHRLERLGVMFKTSEAIEMAMLAEEAPRKLSLWGQLRFDFDDLRWEIKQRQRKLEAKGLFDPLNDPNPMWQFDELPNKLLTDYYRHVQQVQRMVVDPVEALGMTIRDIGQYFFLNRAMRDRQNYMNPMVGTGEYAAETLEQMKVKYGPVKFAALANAAKAYHDLRWVLIERAAESGIYSRDMVEKVFKPAKYSYAKFTPIQYIKRYVSAHVQKQTGFAGHIANPFTETLKMDQNMVYLIARNNAVKTGLAFMNRFYKDETMQAAVKSSDQHGNKIYHDPPIGYGAVEIMENGRPQVVWVDQYIAESMNNLSPQKVDSATRIAQLYYRKYFWKIAILYNLGFGLWGNPMRDFWTNYRKLPLKKAIVGDFFQLLWSYAKSAPRVWKWMHAQPSTPGWGWLNHLPGFHGKEDVLVDEMIDSYSFAMPLSDLGVDEEDPFRYQMMRAGIIDSMGTINRSMLGKLMYGGVHMITAPISFAVQGGEMTSKLAGYMVRQAAGEVGQALAFNMRNFTSTPNYQVKGLMQDHTNAWFVFSTIIKESWKGEYLVATDPKTRSGYWLRTSKLLGLKALQIIAELGGLAQWFGDDLEEKYKAASGYIKKNYLTIPWGETDEQGNGGFITLPQDEMTRLLGIVMRHIIITLKDKDPLAYEGFVSDVVNAMLPGKTPLLTSMLGMSDFIMGTNFIDEFKGTPMMSDMVHKARTSERWKRLLMWQLNTNGLGQFATYDDSRKTKYQMWTQVDPIVGRLIGRMYRVTNYGYTELDKEDLEVGERQQARDILAARGSSAEVKRFFSERYSVNRHDTLFRRKVRTEADKKQAALEYPDYQWKKLYDRTSEAIYALQKDIDKIEDDKTIDSNTKKVRIREIQNKIDTLALNALKASGKGYGIDTKDEIE